MLLGTSAGGMVGIVEGLEEGQRVVVEGVQRLADGTLVEPREAPAGAEGAAS